ncbi:MAG: pyridoxamine 5'-phosphate oxidase family protein [Lachnospiraceae bacterium]|nr:pyridoxamine 5'-phosphate oxidase family protein [Lachnospiraceae bacterium]
MEFRKLVRQKQALSREECIRLLEEEKRGVLAVLGDGSYPYAFPINHWYCEEDGYIYFHGAKTGHHVDAMRSHDKASFCIYDRGYKDGTGRRPWALNIRSVIVFGRLTEVTEQEKAIEISRKLSYKFTSDESYIEEEIRDTGAHVFVYCLRPEHISGKLVNES